MTSHMKTLEQTESLIDGKITSHNYVLSYDISAQFK